MNGFAIKLFWAGLLSANLYLVLSSPSPNSRTRGSPSTFDNIYTALSSLISRPSTFSSTLLPPPDSERRLFQVPDQHQQKASGRSTFHDIVFNDKHKKKKHFQSKDVSFRNPEYEQITQASLGPIKRNAQLDLPGYDYPRPNNPLNLPGEQDRNSVEIIFPDQLTDLSTADKLENPPRETKLKGKLVFKQNNQELNGVDALEALNAFLESDRGAELLETAAKQSQERKDDFSESATARSFAVASNTRTVTAEPLTISSTLGTIRLIQPIQIVTTARPNQFNSRLQSSFPSSRAPIPRTSRPSPRTVRPKTSSFSSFLSSSPNQRPRSPKQQPALTFVDNGLVAVLGRQVAGPPVEGFPNGLPALTPLGVRITLENMFGPNGEMVMNAIPGEAGTDYPVYNSVPDTTFQCSDLGYPGIFTDTESDCQAFYMCQPNGESTAFLCPNGTMFNQQYFVCDWWYNLDCAAQPDFYELNQIVYGPQEEGKVCTSLFCKDD